ncbi:jg26195, partial [Pararge aegeria aegeria]
MNYSAKICQVYPGRYKVPICSVQYVCKASSDACRRIYSNGTLELFPASATVAGAPRTVRCRAASPLGALVSRDVTLQPVADTQWEVSLADATVAAGGVAALWCRAAP